MLGSLASSPLGFEAMNGRGIYEETPSFYSWFSHVVSSSGCCCVAHCCVVLEILATARADASLGQCYLAVAHVLSLRIDFAFAPPCHKSPISDVDNSHSVTSSINSFAMEALNIALETEHVSEIDKFSIDSLLLP